MSPVFLRRFRAERLLREEFEGLRTRVLGAVAGRLGGAGLELDRGDLEVAYALAWQGLYAAVLEGQEIDSPSAWLVLATYRRAIDEHRAQLRAGTDSSGTRHHDGEVPAGAAGDLAEDLELRTRVEHLLEGLSGCLNGRERQAAALCYLQGLSRAEAARQMGISDGRMRKLMEGRGAGDPGVSGKVGELARTIERGEWCESQGSLMRALAYGILARDGERHRLAIKHHRRCPSCRAYVLALRGLASALPPVLLPGARLALSGIQGGAGRIRTAATEILRRVQGAPGAARGAAGASGAGGGLALGGPLGAKFAVGCLLALGVGAGCIGIEADHAPPQSHPAVARIARAQGETAARRPAGPDEPTATAAETGTPSSPSPGRPTAQAAAAREFGPEQALGGRAAGQSSGAAGARALARAAGAGSRDEGSSTAAVASVASAAATRSAVREFSP